MGQNFSLKAVVELTRHPQADRPHRRSLKGSTIFNVKDRNANSWIGRQRCRFCKRNPGQSNTTPSRMFCCTKNCYVAGMQSHSHASSCRSWSHNNNVRPSICSPQNPCPCCAQISFISMLPSNLWSRPKCDAHFLDREWPCQLQWLLWATIFDLRDYNTPTQVRNGKPGYPLQSTLGTLRMWKIRTTRIDGVYLREIQKLRTICRFQGIYPMPIAKFTGRTEDLTRYYNLSSHSKAYEM